MPYSVFEDKFLVDYGLIKIKGKFLEDKMSQAYKEITELIRKHGIAIVLLEDVYYGRNFTSTKSTLQMVGALRTACYENNATSFLVPASKWRKGIIKGGIRENMKEQAVNYVNDNYDLEFTYEKERTSTDHDIAESIIMTEGLVWGRYTLEKVRVFKRKGE